MAPTVLDYLLAAWQGTARCFNGPLCTSARNGASYSLVSEPSFLRVQHAYVYCSHLHSHLLTRCAQSTYHLSVPCACAPQKQKAIQLQFDEDRYEYLMRVGARIPWTA